MTYIVIEAKKEKLTNYLKEVITYKDLLLVLIKRDIKIRYANTSLGILWVVIQPLVTLLIFTFIFFYGIKLDTGNLPYPLIAITGITAWTYFSFVVTQSGNSVLSTQDMIKKIYFPRLIIPLSKAFAGVIDLFVSLVFVFILAAFYQIPLSSKLALMPVFIMLLIIFSLGTGIAISALIVRFRDLKYVVPFVVQIGLYLTPVAYLSGVIPESYHNLYFLNPLAGIIEGIRWTLISDYMFAPQIWYSIFLSPLIFLGGIFIFRNVEENVADLI